MSAEKKEKLLELFKQLRPKDEDSYKKMFWDWIKAFHNKYLDLKITNIQTRSLFHVKAHGFEEKVNPDVSGNLTRSILDSSKILGLKGAINEEALAAPTMEQMATRERGKSQSKGQNRPQGLDPSNVTNIDQEGENTKIVLEILKFYGRDCNVMEVWDMFRCILKKGKNKFTDDEYKAMFLQTL